MRTSITVTKSDTITKTITGCIHQCPYFRVDGMEHVMVCTHPVSKKNDPGYGYGSVTITYDNGDGKFPPECPLLKEQVV